MSAGPPLQGAGPDSAAEQPDAEPFEQFSFDLGGEPLHEAGTRPPPAPPTPSAPPPARAPCPAQMLAFVKHSHPLHRAIPRAVRSMDTFSDCLQQCREDNVDGEQFHCEGVLFTEKKDANLCEFFDRGPAVSAPRPAQPSAQAAAAAEKRDSRGFYFEKLCLKLPPDCEQRAFAFEGFRRRRLALRPFGVSQGSKAECLSACLAAPACRGANFNAANM